MAASTEVYTRPRSQTRLMVGSAIWGAIIVPLAILSTSFLSIPGAFGAGYFWLPQIMMVSGAIFFGPWGMVAAAVGTFLGGMLAGTALPINIAINPIPAFLGNTLLLYVLWFGWRYRWGRFGGHDNGFAIKVTRREQESTTRRLGWGPAFVVIVVTIIIVVMVGFFIGPRLDAQGLRMWGYPLILLVSLPSWWVLKRMGYGIRLNVDIGFAFLAVVISSVASAAMGAFAFQTVGGMGPGAWLTVFPGWALGDIVAGSLGIPLIWSFAEPMERRGLLWRPLN